MNHLHCLKLLNNVTSWKMYFSMFLFQNYE
uniref:Uncharacterized protein n=1 Tax=Heterorhabditis bacteriophora TaxID=37862 RepID=A0A1I7W5U6_HETBA